METRYSFTVTNNEVIFTKDKEQIRYTHERLIENIIAAFNYSYDDADYYAQHLESLCLMEYYKQYKEAIRKSNEEKARIEELKERKKQAEIKQELAKEAVRILDRLHEKLKDMDKEIDDIIINR